MKTVIDEILAYLDYIRSKNCPVSLENTYMGVSYALNVNVRRVSRNENSCSVVTQPPETLSLLPNVWVNIHSDLLLFPVKSKVLQVSSDRTTAVLTNFEYERDKDENRSQPRYVTRNEHTIRIDNNHPTPVYGLINDISTGGISALFKQREGMISPIEAGAACRLNFSLQVNKGGEPHHFDIPAEIVYINPIDEDFSRIGIKMLSTASDQALIRRYIFDKQTNFFQETGPSHIMI